MLTKKSMDLKLDGTISRATPVTRSYEETEQQLCGENAAIYGLPETQVASGVKMNRPRTGGVRRWNDDERWVAC